MANYEIYDGMPVYTDGRVGAVYCKDERWHPFRYFDDGNLDIDDEWYIKASSAYKIAKLTYT